MEDDLKVKSDKFSAVYHELKAIRWKMVKTTKELTRAIDNLLESIDDENNHRDTK